jgi:hypothetical protein
VYQGCDGDGDQAASIYWECFFATSGGLMSYLPGLIDNYRRAYVHRILKGEKPADLPVPDADEM